MRYPTAVDYQQALQIPRALLDPALKGYQPAANPFGLFLVWSGGNAATFRLRNGSGQYLALRCFTRPVGDRARRLSAISACLKAQTDPIFTHFTYIDQGITVEGERYPIVRMPWINGEPLHKYIHAHVAESAAMESLLRQFVDLIGKLEKLGLAHGDLQHGNIMISNEKLVLIDYDAMYVPALTGLRSPESGHENYQHPERNDQYNPNLDRFSSIVIYLGLKALTLRPSLWGTYSPGGENLLFKRSDFLARDRSPLLKDLATLPGLGPLVERFAQVCKGSLDQVPRLADVIEGVSPQLAPVRAWVPAQRVSQYPILAGDARSGLLDHMGQRVAVVGQIAASRAGRDKYHNRPYYFLNFGDWRTGCFTLVLWSDALEEFQRSGKDPADYAGQWVQVTGVLTLYRPGTRAAQPQMEIESPLEIEVLSGEDEAKQRLGPPPASLAAIPPTALAPTPKPQSDQHNLASETERKLARLYEQTTTASPVRGSPPAPRRTSPGTPAVGPSTVANTPPPARGTQTAPSLAPARVPGLQPPLQRPAVAGPPPQKPSPQKPSSTPIPPATPTTSAPPRLALSQTSIDLGRVPVGSTATRTISITNAGSGILQVTLTAASPGISITPARMSCGPAETKTAAVALRTGLIPSSASSPTLTAASGTAEWPMNFAIKVESNGGVATIGLNAIIPQTASRQTPIYTSIASPAPASATPQGLPRSVLIIGGVFALVLLWLLLRGIGSGSQQSDVPARATLSSRTQTSLGLEAVALAPVARPTAVSVLTTPELTIATESAKNWRTGTVDSGVSTPTSRPASSNVQSEIGLRPESESASTPVLESIPDDGPMVFAPTLPPRPTITHAVQSGIELRISARTANLRQGPGLDFRVVVGLDAGSQLEPLERTAENTWWHVRVKAADRAEGWVHRSV